MRIRATLLMLAATFAACGHHVVAGSRGGAVIPWSSATPGPQVTKYAIAPRGVRDCTASDLAVSIFAEGAAGNLAGGINAENTSPSGCRLSGRPTVAILDARGRRIPSDIEASKPEFEADQTPPGWPQVYLRPGDTGTADIFLSGWCTPRMPAHWSVEIPSIDTVFKPIETATPSCAGGSQKADDLESRPTLSVGPFQPQPIFGPQTIYPLEAKIRAPKSIRARTPLRYTVTLTNMSRLPYSFSDCPDYQETLGGTGTKAVGNYVLNCSSVGVIKPGDSVVFAIELRSWIVARDGVAGLSWTIGNVSGSAEVVVIDA